MEHYQDLLRGTFCQFVKELENGTDGSGPSFLDIVRMRWIVKMGHGLRTNCR